MDSRYRYEIYLTGEVKAEPLSRRITPALEGATDDAMAVDQARADVANAEQGVNRVKGEWT